MAAARPELVFLTGPQAGERAVLMTNTAVLGRSANADVRVQEEHASREHVVFMLGPQGWVVENLSANGTLINGKRYKKRKQILLETGDVLGVGLETTILFVSPEDDPEEALRAYRQEHPDLAPAAAGPRAGPAGPPEGHAAGTGTAAAAPGAAVGPAVAAPATVGPAPAAQAAKTARGPGAEDFGADEGSGKNSRYALFGLVCLGMCVFAVALILRPTGVGDSGGGSHGGALVRLTDEEISQALAAPLARSPSPADAAAALAGARNRFPDRLHRQAELYRCVRDFKLHLAYKHRKSFDRVEDERMFEQARDELDKLVREKYDAAWKFEKARSWRNAKRIYEELREILPMSELDADDPLRTKVMANVLEHLTYVNRNLRAGA